MITDKLLAFADNKSISATADSDVIDLGTAGDEIARTLNLVAQIDEVGSTTSDNATITASLKVQKVGEDSYSTVMTFPAASIVAGARFINFAKLPLGALGGKMKLSLTIAGTTIAGVKYSAWLTPSVEA